MRNSTRLILVCCFSLCLAQAAQAATFTVTKIADTDDGICNADCSLREAIAAAVAVASDDVIEFSPLFNTAQTITLSGTDIIIAGNGTLTINGPGANLLTVSGNNTSRVFTNQIIGTVQAVTTINNLRVTGGNGVSSVLTGRAGGVYNNGSVLRLNNVIVTGNTAANGGGLNNATGAANLTLDNCTVTNNTATSSGGGMQNFSTSTLTILNSTISGNTSNLNGLAGGAIQANGVVIIANSTISGNNAPVGSAGGIIFNGTALTLNNVTIANNTAVTGAAGLHKSTATLNANVRNTIIASNTGAAATPDALGPFSSQGNNLIGVVGTSTGWVASDLVNRSAFLAPLANNGGPTQTHALLPNSPAINAGQNCVVAATCAAGNPPTALTNDQRGTGFQRQASTAVDIGAIESQFTVVAAAAFDFDGDAKSDISVFRPSNAIWYLNRSTAGLGGAQWGLSADKLAPADYDGDGKTDIAVWRESEGKFYILNSSNSSARVENFGLSGDTLMVGDWDGDGKADPATYRGGSTSTFFYRGSLSNPTGNITYVVWGSAGDRAMRGDFDGDGKRDAAVFRPTNNRWYIRNSSTGQARYDHWGLASDRFVPADYDGDAKTDLAIFRDGMWYIKRSSTSQAQYVNFGVAADVTVPADYDGDGSADIAVFRNGQWFLQQSTAGFSVFSFGLGTDRAVPSSEN